VGVCAIIVQGGMVGAVIRRLGEQRTLVLGLLCGAIGFGLYGSAHQGWIFLLGVPFAALWGLASPALSALMTRKLGADQQGQLQGANSSIVGVAGLIGPLVFSLAFAWGLKAALPGIGFWMSSLLLLSAAAWAFWLGRRA
jgi:MFS transporter, DHA1 family, tetracycline resistance protein